MIGQHGLYGRLGAAPPTAPQNAGQAFLDYLPAIGETVGVVIGATQDPVQRLGVLRAELQEALRYGRPESTIRALQAKIAAAEREVALQVEWEAQQRRVGALVEVSIAAGSLFLIALAGAAVVRAVRA